MLKEENNEKPLCADSTSGPTMVEKPASTSGLGFQPANLEASQTNKGKPEVKQTLSQPSEDLLVLGPGSRQSTFVPWEKAGKEDKKPLKDVGLLQEVVSLCHMSCDFQQGLSISEESRSENQT